MQVCLSRLGLGLLILIILASCQEKRTEEKNSTEIKLSKTDIFQNYLNKNFINKLDLKKNHDYLIITSTGCGFCYKSTISLMNKNIKLIKDSSISIIYCENEYLTDSIKALKNSFCDTNCSILNYNLHITGVTLIKTNAMDIDTLINFTSENYKDIFKKLD